MKRNVNKVAADFEKILSEEFQTKWESKNKSQQNDADNHDTTEKKDEKGDNNNNKNQISKNEDYGKKADAKN